MATFLRGCAECGEPFKSQRRKAEFCSKECRMAHNNRRRDRGAMLLDLYVHTRFNRQKAGERGLKTMIDRMIGNWVAEDREAGRRSMRPIDEVVQAAVSHTSKVYGHRAGK